MSTNDSQSFRARSSVRSTLRVLSLALLVPALFSLAHCDGEVPLTAPDGAELSMSANPTSIPAENGLSQVTVVGFKGADDGGGTLADGTQIFFSTSVGVIEERVTMQNGIARATLRSNGRSGQATVSARSGNGITATDVMVDIGTAGTTTITVSGNPASLGPFDNTSEITATVTDTNNNVVPDVPIIFSSSAGALASAGAILRTNTNGQAFDRLTLIGESTATVTATSGTASGSFTVNRGTFPAPVIDSVFPTLGSPGTTIAVTITGQNFQPGATTSFGAGIGINTVDFVNAETLVPNITIDSNAADGERTVTVTNPDGQSATFASGFIVGLPGVGNNTAPTCAISVGPTIGGMGTSASPFLLPGATLANFDASGSADSDGIIVSYLWNFGDGGSSTTAVAFEMYLYTVSGMFPATVVVTDNDGGTCAATIFVDEP